MKNHAKWLAGLLLTGWLMGCSSTQQAGDKEDITAALPEAYKQNCLSCHGDQLQGRRATGLQEVGSRLTEEQLFDLIYNGTKGMPAYGRKLSEDEITSLASWLSEQR